MDKGFRRSAAFVAAVALAIPAAAGAHGGPPPGVGHGHGHGNDGQQPSAESRSHGRPNRAVGYVFAGTVKSIAGNTVTVSVLHANHDAHALVGQDVEFDVSAARIVVRDANGDGKRDLGDVAVGDRVQVLARLPRDLSTATQPFAATALIDKAHRHTHESQPPAGSDS